MGLGELAVPGRSTNLDNRKVRVYCACSRSRLFEHVFSLM